MELRTYLRILRAQRLGLIRLMAVGVVSAFGRTPLQLRVCSASEQAVTRC